MNQIILGMLAHVDAGKTTLTESLLYTAGAISQVGRVDHGTAFLDTNSLEKSRGITIYSKEARFAQGDREFTLLDTPGHVDFSPEMERSLEVLDYAVLVISGSDGVQSHTETVWRLLRSHKIPTFIFVNKMDLPDLNQDEIMEELSTRLDSGCVNFSSYEDKGSSEFMEQVALCDESLLSLFMEENKLDAVQICQGVRENHIFPCFFGSALKMEHISDFLEGLSTYTTGTEENNHKFGGKIFKITRDSNHTRLTHVKVTSGAIAVKDILNIGDYQEKINEIRLYSGEKYTSVHSVGTGTVCALVGLQHSLGGMSLGVEKASIPPSLAPVLTYTLGLPAEIDGNQALTQLKQLQEEDPALQLQWLEEKKSIQIQIMGDVQLEVLSSVILERFGFAVEFGERAIIYRETLAPGQLLEGVGHYEPLRHYAEVQLHLEPLPCDSGMVFELDCPTHILEQNYQNLVLTHLKERVHRGVLTDSPLTDLKITLKAGRAHQKHTVGGDFREATYRAIRQGILQGKSVLLEPWSKVLLKIPNQNSGRAMSDFQRMGGTCEIVQILDNITDMVGAAPLTQLGNYPTTVTSYTGGRGQCQVSFLGYRPCQNSAAVISALDCSSQEGGDSVFCKEGAGYTVAWDEVHGHMHTESRLPKAVEESPVEVVRQRSRQYANQLAEDKDLMEIFQRTYGTISPEKLQRYRKNPSETYSPSLKAQKIKPQFLLVDGYNIIFAWDDLAVIAGENLDAARVALMNTLCNYQGYHNCELIVVFDAYKVKGGTGAVEKFHNITVVYTREAETADMYIERATRQLATDFTVRVATSDGLEQLIILSQGGLRVSAKQFYLEVQQMKAALEKFLY